MPSIAGADLGLRSVPKAEVAELHRRACKGDPAALRYFGELNDVPGRCFLCDAPLQPGEGLALVLPDPPQARRGLAMIARECASCAALPKLTRLRRITVLMRALWPGWHPSRPGWNQR